MRPLPEKWHGLTDNEQIYRQRYLDLIVNEDPERGFRHESIIREIREFFWVVISEVETPMLQSVSGRPQPVHSVRISMLWTVISSSQHSNCTWKDCWSEDLIEFLKSGGFRNEGLSRRHNLNSHAWLIRHTPITGYDGTYPFSYPTGCGKSIGYFANGKKRRGGYWPFGEWREAKYKDLILEAVGRDDWFELPKEAKLEKTKIGIEVDPASKTFEVTNDVFEKIIEHTLIQPTFVPIFPANFVPWLRLLKLILPQLMYLSFVSTVRKSLQRIPSKTTPQYSGKPLWSR